MEFAFVWVIGWDFFKRPLACFGNVRRVRCVASLVRVVSNYMVIHHCSLWNRAGAQYRTIVIEGLLRYRYWLTRRKVMEVKNRV